MTKKIFREITISGSAAQRGHQYGSQLASEIAETIAYYREIFNLPDAEIMDLAGKFRDTIEGFNPDYMVEINAMAGAARLDPLWIVALNARTEILSHGGLAVNELVPKELIEVLQAVIILSIAITAGGRAMGRGGQG